MRIAVLSDIHGNLPALLAVVADLSRRGADLVVNLGDSLSGPLSPKETADYLKAQSWVHLAGNHERQLLSGNPADLCPSDAYAYSRLDASDLEWAATLRPSAALDEDLLLCHGTPHSDSTYLLETVEPDGVRLATQEEVAERLGSVNARVILCGHSHVPRKVRTPTGQLVVNPGSVGLQAYDDDLPFYHVVATGSPEARYALVEGRGDSWSATLISLPYDHAPMARLAAKNGRGDWAEALSTGTLQAKRHPSG